jgi:vacuolar-type H+-ATPase subunit E/Vma4
MAKLQSVEDVSRDYDSKARRVLEDATLRAEYQREVLETLYDEAREQIQKQIDEERETLEDNLRVARRLLFQSADMEGNKDKALLYMLYHHHLEKVWEMDSANELDRYFQRVTLVDDVVGIKACLVRAVELSQTDIVNRILHEYPSWQEVFEHYTEASEELREYSRSPHAFFGSGRLRTPREYLP